jgi:hypothetical protein
MRIACDLKLPVAVAHVGCVTVPAVGAAGVAGCALTTILDDAGEDLLHGLCKVYVPAVAVTKPFPSTYHLGKCIHWMRYNL